MRDEEYLAQAGIKDTESGEATASSAENATTTASANPTATASTTGSSSESPTPTSGAATSGRPGAKSEAQKAVEMYELSGQRFPANAKFKIPHGGKILEVELVNMINRYRQGEHFNDQYSKFNEERKTFEQRKNEYEAAMQFKSKYGGLQEWSEKNPEDWKVIWDLYQNRERHLLASRMGQNPNALQNAIPGAGQPPNAQGNFNPLIDKISKLEEKLGKYEQAYNGYTSQQQRAQEEADTNLIKTEMSDFQKEYPEIDLQERDPDGVVLWAKIIQYGLQNGYSYFKPAAREYLRQRTEDAIASRARAEALKSLKSDRLQGVVKRSPTPIQQNGKGESGLAGRDVKKMSYGQIAEYSKQMLAGMNS